MGVRGLVLAKIIAVVMGLIMVSAVPASAEKRVALVIGNSAYQRAPKLPNPASDAAAVVELFRDAGFDVISKHDVGISNMRRALREFAITAQDADIAVVYFAGHGIEIDGSNYLIPVDAVLERDTDVDDETVSLDRIIRILEPVKRLRLIILDACRDNPFSRSMKRTLASRSISRGLAKVEPTTSDTLIAFAAKAGSTASDGDGPHSPFTTALLDNLAQPGLDLRIAFGRVRDEVLAATGHQQEPFVYGSLGGSIVALVPAKTETRSNAPVGNISPSEQANLEITFWNSIKDAKNARLFEAYLHRYPNGTFSDIARITLDGLKTAALTPPPPKIDDKTPISDPGLLKEVRQRLYELNFDPGPFEGPYTEEARDAIREYEQQSNLPQSGVATMGLLRKLREVGGLKPWGAIVYGKDSENWGMAWAEPTRQAAVTSARASCGGDPKKCPVEISFFGTECGVFAHSSSSWASTARDELAKAKAAALADCNKRGKSCEIVASVCADGAERFIAGK